jgi:hypothetical protein
MEDTIQEKIWAFQVDGNSIWAYYPHFLGFVGKNTLWTSKIGSDLHAYFDRIETTFLPTTQDL